MLAKAEVEKPWIQVDILPGQLSDSSKLNFESHAKFIDGKTL